MRELKITKKNKKEVLRLNNLMEEMEKFLYEIPENYERGKFTEELDFNEFLTLKILYPLRERWSEKLLGNLKIWFGNEKDNIKKLKTIGCDDFNIDIKECPEKIGVNVFYWWKYKLDKQEKICVMPFYFKNQSDRKKLTESIEIFKKANRRA